MPSEDTCKGCRTILSTLQKMEQARNNSTVPEKLDAMTVQLAQMQTVVETNSRRINETHKVLLGNGNPVDGLYHQFSLFASEFKTLKKIIEDEFIEVRHDIELHKKDHEKTGDKLWDIAKPILIMFATWIVMGGLFYGVFHEQIQQLLTK